MTVIARFDRALVRQLGHEIEAACAAIAERHGVDIKYRGVTWSDNSATFKVQACAMAADGTAMTPEMEAFKALAVVYGLKPEDLGRTFTFRGDTYTICGLKPKSRVSPILAKRSSGATYKFPSRVVRMYLGDAA